MSASSSSNHRGRRGPGVCTDRTKVNSARWKVMQDGNFGKPKKRRKEHQAGHSSVGNVVDKAFKEKEDYYREIQFTYNEELNSDEEDECEGNEQANENTDDNLILASNISAQSSDSLGGKIDHGKNKGRGPYSFILSGVNHHRIGTLLPRAGQSPVHSQLYIYDIDNELANRISAVSKHKQKAEIDPSIVELIKTQLDVVNPFLKQYRMTASLIDQKTHSPLRLCLLGSRKTDARIYNTPSASEVAILVVGDLDDSFTVRDIIVDLNSGELHRINEFHASYLPLQYPLLFCYGEDGY